MIWYVKDKALGAVVKLRSCVSCRVHVHYARASASASDRDGPRRSGTPRLIDAKATIGTMVYPRRGAVEKVSMRNLELAERGKKGGKGKDDGGSCAIVSCQFTVIIFIDTPLGPFYLELCCSRQCTGEQR